MSKKYSVNDAVWIATALMSAEVYMNNPEATKSDMFFKQVDIVKRAEMLTDKKVNSARVQQWVNGDDEKSTRNYLRADSDGAGRRLAMMDEFASKTYPEALDPEDQLMIGDRAISMKELMDFVKYQYPSVIRRENEGERKEALKSDMINKKGIEQLKAFRAKLNKVQFAKNMILYGPPGTGKTYSSAIYAVAICDGRSIDEVKNMDYDDVMIRYRELVKEERIAFTTFHQSYGYEEFIEGIKPVIDDGGTGLGYTMEDGVFKKFCDKASAIKVETEDFEVAEDATVWKVTIREKVREDCFANDRVRINWSLDSEGAKGFVNDIKKGDIIITTSGSRRVINGIGAVIEDDAYTLNVENDRTARNVKWLAKNIETEIVHINSGKMLHRMTVARVLGMKVSDILSVAKENNPELNSTTIVENQAPYVFIIDEINRGNISKIFGELITLIEDTKRAGMKEEVSAILPYSGIPFRVPSNVYILGTMNTADRSIALMDTALRRRFQFIEMMPDAGVLRKIGADRVEDLDVAFMLEKMNERIAFLYDREHTIGHAFFTKLAGNPSIEVLASIFRKSVIPLLQEYFYEDYQKIQLVLGDNGKSNDAHKFVLDTDVKAKNIFKGNVDDGIDLPEKKYTINQEAFYNIESYKEII